MWSVTLDHFPLSVCLHTLGVCSGHVLSRLQLQNHPYSIPESRNSRFLLWSHDKPLNYVVYGEKYVCRAKNPFLSPIDHFPLSVCLHILGVCFRHVLSRLQLHNHPRNVSESRNSRFFIWSHDKSLNYVVYGEKYVSRAKNTFLSLFDHFSLSVCLHNL